MLTAEHLTLKLVRLNRSDAWPNKGQGFVFVLAKGGNGRYACDSATQPLLPGDVLVTNSVDEGKIAATSDEMVFWWLSLRFEHLLPLFAVDEIVLLHNIIESFKGPKLYPAASAVAQECHRLVAAAPPQGNFDHRSQVLRVAATVLSAEFKNTRNKQAGFVRMEDHMIQVFEELSPVELLTLSVGDLANKFSCSRRHLNRLFHQHFGCSVASLRMEMRLLKALSLLRDPDVKIINVAEQCGFNHLGLFNACFKKRFGNTPGKWRKGAPGVESPGLVLDMLKPSSPISVNGQCAPVAKLSERAPTSQKSPSMLAGSHSNGPANPKLRERIISNIRQVSAQMGANSGMKLKNCA